MTFIKGEIDINATYHIGVNFVSGKEYKQLQSYLIWFDEKYHEMLSRYIAGMSRVDLLIDECIAAHFIKSSDNDYLNRIEEFIETVLTKFVFQTKWRLLLKILNKSYKDLLKIDPFIETTISRLQKARNAFSHSTICSNIYILRKQNMNMIYFNNMLNSRNQPIKWTIEQFEKDNIDIEKYLDILTKIHQQISGSREEYHVKV